MEYRRRGEREVILVGDTIVMNTWDPEPPQADAFWFQRVEPLSKEQRNAVARALAGLP